MSTTIERTNFRRVDWGHVGLLRSARLPVVVAGAAVTLVGASRVRDESYWMDEAVSAAVVHRSFGGLARVLWDQEAGMLPYYVGLWFWSRLFDGDTGLRMFSVFGAVAAAMLVVYLATRWYGQRTAWLAAALLITNPFFLRYLTEARAYSWLMFTSVAVAWAIDAVATRPSNLRFAMLGIVWGCGIAIHVLFVAVVVLAVIVALLFQKISWDHRRGLTIAALACIGVTLPAVPALIARGNQLDWLVSESFEAARAQALELYGGELRGVLILLGMVGAALALLSPRARLWATANAVVIAIGFPAVLGVLTLVKPLFVARYLAPAFPFLIIAAAAGLDFMAARYLSRRLATLAVSALAIGCVVVFLADHPLTDQARGRDGPREVIEFIDSQIRPGDQIVVDHYPLTILHYLGYRPGVDPGATSPDDGILYPIRPPIVAQVDATRASPTVYYILWDPKGPDAASGAIAAGRHLREARTFGDTTVFVLDRD